MVRPNGLRSFFRCQQVHPSFNAAVGSRMQLEKNCQLGIAVWSADGVQKQIIPKSTINLKYISSQIKSHNAIWFLVPSSRLERPQMGLELINSNWVFNSDGQSAAWRYFTSGQSVHLKTATLHANLCKHSVNPSIMFELQSCRFAMICLPSIPSKHKSKTITLLSTIISTWQRLCGICYIFETKTNTLREAPAKVSPKPKYLTPFLSPGMVCPSQSQNSTKLCWTWFHNLKGHQAPNKLTCKWTDHGKNLAKNAKED